MTTQLRIPKNEWQAVGLTIGGARRWIPITFCRRNIPIPVRIQFSPELQAERLARHRRLVVLCGARLRAERAGKSTAGFPPRIRRIRRMKTWLIEYEEKGRVWQTSIDSWNRESALARFGSEHPHARVRNISEINC